jgi:hypothetical protein
LIENSEIYRKEAILFGQKLNTEEGNEAARMICLNYEKALAKVQDILYNSRRITQTTRLDACQSSSVIPESSTTTRIRGKNIAWNKLIILFILVGSIGLCYWHPGVSTLKASQDPVGVK